jgi:predicted secreted protein
MAALAGIGASFTEASTAVNQASKWTLSIKNAQKDVTPFGASGSWAINIATINSWTAKVTAFIDTTDTGATNLYALIGSTIALTLNVQSTPHGFTGSAILTGIDPSADVQGAQTVDFSFTGTGAITYS